MAEFKISRLTAYIIFLFLLSFSAQAQTRFEFFAGNQFTLLQANALADTTKIKLISTEQKAYGFDFQLGRAEGFWYTHGDFLQYHFNSGPTITDETLKYFVGTQSNYELGRGFKVFRNLPVFFKYGLAYRESLYIDSPDVSFHLEKRGIPNLVFNLQFPLISFSSKYSNDLNTRSGIFINLNASAGRALNSSGPKSISMYGGKIALRKKLGSSFECDIATDYSVENLKTQFYDQKRADLNFLFTLRYVPQHSYNESNIFFPKPKPP